MKHFGDITKIKGSEVPLTHIVCGGSPCQDLSVAGKRAGLAGERSGLFMEQIRIIKEMRDESYKELSMQGSVDPSRIVPRFMVWENVPGAFSSNNGEDFRVVLEETARVKDKDAAIPRLEGKQKWSPSGCIMGDGWSIAWRVHDAQFWGVPQRRKRIALVADFGGSTAPEILFERKGMSGNTEESGKPREDAATDVRSGVEETGRTISFQERAGKPGGGKGILIQEEHTGALSTLNNQSVCYPINTMVASRNNNESRTTFGVGNNGEAQFTLSAAHEHAVSYGICSDKSNSMLSGNPHSGIYEAETARTLDLNGGSPACNQGGMAVVQGADMYNGAITGDIAATLNARSCVAGGQSGPSVICIEGNGQRESHKGDGYKESDIMYTLNTVEQHAVACGTKYTEEPYNATTGSFMRAGNSGVAETLAARDYKDPQIVCNSVVRRLTPLECERLQGYPVVRKVRFTEMTKDEYIAWNINEGNIIVDTEYGKVFATRGQGGIKLDEPKELMGSVVNGYRVVSIRNGNTKMQCRVHRIVWIAEHGVIPDGYVIDHINNDKQDNRLCNLQLLTPKENSTKARQDGLYKVHGEAGQSKISDEIHDLIQYVYGNTDLTCRQMAEIFGISKSRVHQIIHDEPWTDIGEWVDSKGKKHKDADSPRYKALGNSIALPYWSWMAERMMPYLPENPTMASLFDGIGGFPLVFSRCGCKPVWASEIEEFAIAVTKRRFPEEKENK